VSFRATHASTTRTPVWQAHSPSTAGRHIFSGLFCGHFSPLRSDQRSTCERRMLSPTPPRFLVIVLPSTSPTHGHGHGVQYRHGGKDLGGLPLLWRWPSSLFVCGRPPPFFCGTKFSAAARLSHKQALTHLPHTFPFLSSTTHSSKKPTWPS
jgi:hypothetical protein